MRLLGLTGFARSGKDTVAKMVAELTPGVTKRAAFADLLKLSAARSLHVPVSPDDVGIEGVRRWADRFKADHEIRIVDGEGELIHSISGRAFLQRFGTEGHRDIFGDDFWIEVTNFEPPNCDLLIFTDVRYPNEAKAVRDRGGEIWRVVRDDETPAEQHRSETPLSDELVDRELLNTAGIPELLEQVKGALAGDE